MTKFDDYINSLEGKTDISIENVVSDLLNIHNEEVGIANAKITDLDSQIAGNVSAIAEREAEIQRVKAKNWDLANQIPANVTEETDQGEGLPDGSRITIDDLLG